MSTWGKPGSYVLSPRRLDILFLGQNRFLNFPDMAQAQYEFPLRSLTLNTTKITWKKVACLECHQYQCLADNARCMQAVDVCRFYFPKLEELHLCDNGIKRLDSACENSEPMTQQDLAQAFLSLKLLNLEDNLIESWGQVWLLSLVPRYVLLCNFI